MLKKQVLRILINILSLFTLVYIMPDIQMNSWQMLTISALVLFLLNLIIRPILLLIALPLNIITLGIFTIIINACMVLAANYLVSGFSNFDFLHAIIVSLIILVYGSILKPIYKYIAQ